MRARRILLFVVATLGVVLITAAFAQQLPFARRQGVFLYGLPDVRYQLPGHLVTTPVTDWSFSDRFPTVRIQTRTWGFIPYSVSIFFAHHDDQLYLYSSYAPPAPGQEDLRDQFPRARAWNRNLVRDPHGRLQIGDQIFNVRASVVTDPKEIDIAKEAFFIKYPQLRAGQAQPEARRIHMHFFRVVPEYGS
jgi:hypothetical protein